MRLVAISKIRVFSHSTNNSSRSGASHLMDTASRGSMHAGSEITALRATAPCSKANAGDSPKPRTPISASWGKCSQRLLLVLARQGCESSECMAAECDISINQSTPRRCLPCVRSMKEGTRHEFRTACSMYRSTSRDRSIRHTNNLTWVNASHGNGSSIGTVKAWSPAGMTGRRAASK